MIGGFQASICIITSYQGILSRFIIVDLLEPDDALASGLCELDTDKVCIVEIPHPSCVIGTSQRIVFDLDHVGYILYIARKHDVLSRKPGIHALSTVVADIETYDTSALVRDVLPYTRNISRRACSPDLQRVSVESERDPASQRHWMKPHRLRDACISAPK